MKYGWSPPVPGACALVTGKCSFPSRLVEERSEREVTYWNVHEGQDEYGDHGEEQVRIEDRITFQNGASCDRETVRDRKNP